MVAFDKYISMYVSLVKILLKEKSEIVYVVVLSYMKEDDTHTKQKHSITII